MIEAILAITALALVFGLLLGYADIRFRVEGDPVVDKIEALLPQTQCGQCGYPGCRPYAEAVANEGVAINLCPPGGETTMLAMADLLGRDPAPVDESAGEPEKAVAVIDEAECIGCTKCIQACPVDAILGASKLMHTVIEADCTGCEKCVEPCPVDCIDMVPIEKGIRDWKWPYPTNNWESKAA